MSYPVLEYKIDQLATIRVEANGKIGERLSEYEKRMPGVDHYVRYGFSHKGTLKLAVDKLVCGQTTEAVILPEQDVRKELMFRPVIFEQPIYTFSVEFNAGLKGLKEDSIEVWHYLDDFKSRFVRHGRLLIGQYTFNTEPGQFRFEVRYLQGGLTRSVWIDFVVAATKMDVQSDYRKILHDIEEWDREQLFVGNAKTVHDVSKKGVASNEEAKSWVVYFDAALDHYETALKHILYQPHQMTVSETRYRRVEQVKSWTPSLVRDYARMQGDVSRLENHRFGEGVRETTFDTMENRFVKYTIKGLADLLKIAVESFKDGQYDSSFVNGVKARQERMMRYLHEQVLQRVGEFRGAGQSLVLQMRPGYSDIRIVWEKMTSLFSTDITLGKSASVGLMRVSALYEFWCFIVLKKVLDTVISAAPNIGSVVIPDKNSVDYKKAAKLAIAAEDKLNPSDAIVYQYVKKVAGRPDRMVAELVFQQTYNKHPSGDESSYSAPYSQRPDIVIRLFDKSRTYTYIFDAKYQIEESGSRDGVPKDSLDKMHCYRDAILWRKAQHGGNERSFSHEVVGAYILYPADETKPSYPHEYDGYLTEQNVGAIPLLPEKTSRLTAHIKKLVEGLKLDSEDAGWLLEKKQVIPQRGLFYTEEEMNVLKDENTLVVGLLNGDLLLAALGAKKYPVDNALLAQQGKAKENIHRLALKAGDRHAFLIGKFAEIPQQASVLTASGHEFAGQSLTGYCQLFEIDAYAP